MEISLKAYAKINLSLDIVGKREDNYHLIDSIMQTVSIFDRITVSTNSSGCITVNCNGIDNEDNICYFVAKEFFSLTEIKGGADITIDKAIPVSAGMGGGSTDAAAVLVALNKIYDYPLEYNQLKSIALKAGADVPFFLKGGTARATGIGEVLEDVENNLSYALVLVKNGVKKSTKNMYEVLDNRSVDNVIPHTNNLCGALKDNNFEEFCKNIGNDFDALWDNTCLKQELKDYGAYACCLSGSGPTVFAVFKDVNNAIETAAVLRNKYTEVYTAVPVKSSFEFE